MLTTSWKQFQRVVFGNSEKQPKHRSSAALQQIHKLRTILLGNVPGILFRNCFCQKKVSFVKNKGNGTAFNTQQREKREKPKR